MNCEHGRRLHRGCEECNRISVDHPVNHDLAVSNARLYAISIGDIRNWPLSAVLAFNLACDKLDRSCTQDEKERLQNEIRRLEVFEWMYKDLGK